MNVVLVNPHSTLAEFAEQHQLTLQVRERAKPQYPEWRFSAIFADCELVVGHYLEIAPGSGETVDKAIADYRDKITDGTFKRYLGTGLGYETIKVPILDA